VAGVDVENGLILLKGAIPGPDRSVILVRTPAKAPKGAGK
jgi:ribosomal protein L3